MSYEVAVFFICASSPTQSSPAQSDTIKAIEGCPVSAKRKIGIFLSDLAQPSE